MKAGAAEGLAAGRALVARVAPLVRRRLAGKVSLTLAAQEVVAVAAAVAAMVVVEEAAARVAAASS